VADASLPAQSGKESRLTRASPAQRFGETNLAGMDFMPSPQIVGSGAPPGQVLAGLG